MVFGAALDGLGSGVNLDLIERIARVVLVLAIGIGAAYLVSMLVQRSTQKRLSAQTVMILRKVVFYVGIFCLGAVVLPDLDRKSVV